MTTCIASNLSCSSTVYLVPFVHTFQIGTRKHYIVRDFGASKSVFEKCLQKAINRSRSGCFWVKTQSAHTVADFSISLAYRSTIDFTKQLLLLGFYFHSIASRNSLVYICRSLWGRGENGCGFNFRLRGPLNSLAQVVWVCAQVLKIVFT